MRPPRVIIAGVFFITTVFLTFKSLRSSHEPRTIATADIQSSGPFSFFSARAPFSLFPPNAIITLTHDNTTAFLARPAAFGPSLPIQGLKGQLWIGSGFGDENIRQPIASGAEGETGCSDVPGWGETYSKSSNAAVKNAAKAVANADITKLRTKTKKRSKDEDQPFESAHDAASGNAKNKLADDGTDDYLHRPLPDSANSKTADMKSTELSSDHADIQSIQEGAEIAGKVVLLSRGDCGFLEKVKWAQRRGAIALIVGDNTMGGPLIQMYARGDTSNVTIPSVFTSRTTAHLLSSLMGPGSFIEDTLDENGKLISKVKQSNRKKLKKASGPTFTQEAQVVKATMVPRRPSKVLPKKASTIKEDKSATLPTERPGWFRALFFGVGNGKSKSENSRPPSSGELDWVLVDDWKDGEKANKKTQGKPKEDLKKANNGKAEAGDDFVIGVQDWRDKDLVGSQEAGTGEGGLHDGASQSANSKAKQNAPPAKLPGKKEGNEKDLPLQGGSITPGSGEYSTSDAATSKEKDDGTDASGRKSKGLLTAIFGDDEEDIEYPPHMKAPTKAEAPVTELDDDDETEGLWVTLTPTSGASPFLDTLLVLVVSPLVTLTVVYALLLIRSRIRRRRWRAPKSVVERLPVRTYQTVPATSSGTQTPRQPNPTSSSVTTPLLQRSASPSRPRPRSRTTTGIPEAEDLVRVNSSPLQVPGIPPRTTEQEKGASVSSEWRKYMGRQVECVVCLEEYVDGVSRVMSLPCGHEFHADCITPWLTTRRRTCPICKGDVVRSLARGSPSSMPRYDAYHDDDSDEDIQTQAAQTVNNSSSSALPIGGIIEDEDVEQGVSGNVAHANRNTSTSWRDILPSSWRGERERERVSQEDRSR